MKTIALIVSFAALASSLAVPLTNESGSLYNGTLPGDKSFSVTFSDPIPTTLEDGTPASNFNINVSGIDLTQFGVQNSYSMPSFVTDTTTNYDLCEVFIGNVFAATGILPAIQFPQGMQHFLTQQEFFTKYNLQLAADNQTEPGTPPPSGPGGSPPPMGCC